LAKIAPVHLKIPTLHAGVAVGGTRWCSYTG